MQACGAASNRLKIRSLSAWVAGRKTGERIALRSPSGRAVIETAPLKEESNGQARGSARGPGVVPARRSRDRVLGHHAVLPGPRNGRRRRFVADDIGRKGVGVVPFLLVIALVVGVSPIRVGAADAGATGGVYRRPLGHEPPTLDPARISDIYSRSVSQQIFDGLVQFDQTLAIAPALAQFWKASRDGLTWTFMLRKGVQFHHGREVTADDVVYSFTRILDPRTRSGAADLFLIVKGAREFREGRAKSVAGLVALDRRTVQITLDDNVAPFVAIAAVGHAKIVPRDLVDAQGEAFGAQPVGTGPFKLARWDRGREIVLDANADYFDGAPRLSRLVFRIFPGEQRDAMQEEFQKGNLEDAPVPARVDRRALAASGGYIYVKRPMISTRFYGFNTRVKPLNDRRVRQAIVEAIDREAIVEGIYFGQV